MNLAFIVGAFPTLSETFILNQMAGLIDADHHLDIFPSHPNPSATHHPIVEQYHLLNATHYPPSSPHPSSLRLLKAASLSALHGLRQRGALIRCLRSLSRDGGQPISPLRLIPFLSHPTFDVILCHYGPTGDLACRLRQAGLIRGRIVTVFHGFDMTRHLKTHGPTAYDRLFREGDLFLPISNHWRKKLIELGCPPDKTIVHHMGIDPRKLTYASRTRSQSGPTNLLSIARLVEKKGLEYSIRAVAKLIAQGRPLNYVILGDGPLRPALQELVNSLDMQRHITLPGAQPHDKVQDCLEQSHILLAPSVTAEDGDQEGIPVVIMEAMAMGLPVISTHHSGIPELVHDGTSGYLIPERDEDALSHALAQLLDQPETWPALGKQGRAMVEREFDNHTLNHRLHDLLTELVDPP